MGPIAEVIMAVLAVLGVLLGVGYLIQSHRDTLRRVEELERGHTKLVEAITAMEKTTGSDMAELRTDIAVLNANIKHLTKTLEQFVTVGDECPVHFGRRKEDRK